MVLVLISDDLFGPDSQWYVVCFLIKSKFDVLLQKCLWGFCLMINSLFSLVIFVLPTALDLMVAFFPALWPNYFEFSSCFCTFILFYRGNIGLNLEIFHFNKSQFVLLYCFVILPCWNFGWNWGRSAIWSLLLCTVYELQYPISCCMDCVKITSHAHGIPVKIWSSVTWEIFRAVCFCSEYEYTR